MRQAPYRIAMALCLACSFARAQMGDMQMPGMHHETPASANPQAPTNANHPTPANGPATRAEQSLKNSAAQQATQTSKPSDNKSEMRNASRLQEAENPSLLTGDDLPAPDLLADARKRTSLTLEQFQKWAEEKSPAIAQAHALQQSSEQQGRQAALPPNPTIGYSGDHIRGGSYHGGEQGAFVQQTVVLGGKLGLRRDIYRQQAAADGIGIEEQTYRVRSDIQRDFYRALTAQAMVDVRQHLLQLALDSVETSHQLSNLGQTDAPDVLQAEVEAERAKIDLNDAQREYLQRFSMLAAESNQPDVPVAPVAGDLESVPDLNANSAVSAAIADNPSLHYAQQQVAVAEARVKEVKRESVPNLTVQAGEWYSGETLDGINKKAGWMGFAQAGVEVPLWNRNQGSANAAKADVARAQAEVTRTQLQLRQRAEPMAQQYLSARFRADRYRTQLIPRARRAYELYNMKYQQMAGAYPQVLLSQRTLFDLQIGYLRALEDEWMNAIALQNYTLQGGLEAPRSGSDVTRNNMLTGSTP
jgi:cobalt-zinc-cadmium efflux system outer membrane protein